MSRTADAENLSAKEWRLHIHLFEKGPATTARVVLDTGDNVLETRGEAHRNPHDVSVPEIGDELAAGRALVSMGQHLLQAAAVDVEGVEAGLLPSPGAKLSGNRCVGARDSGNSEDADSCLGH